MSDQNDSARLHAEVSAAVATIEDDAFKLLYAVFATLKGEPARCARRTCRAARHCTAAADNAFCSRLGIGAEDALAHAGREFLLRHAHRHPLPKGRRGAGAQSDEQSA